MKKAALVSLGIFMLASITNAQIKKGSIYFGGNISGSTVKQNTDNSTPEGKRHTVYISPAAGVAIEDNLIAGVDLNYSNSQSKNYLGYQDYKTHTYGGGVFLRKYITIANRFYFFGETDLGYSQYKYQSLTSAFNSYFSQTTQKTISSRLYPGLSLNVWKSFYIETSFPDLIELGYAHSTSQSNSFGTTVVSKDHNLFFDAGLLSSINLNVGLRFIIPKK